MQPLDDPRVLLLPVEASSPEGLGQAATGLTDAARWPDGGLALVDVALRLYWTRGRDLARRARGWVPPRQRHLVVVAGDPLGVRPYVQLLGTSAWLVWACDVDPACSHPELLAWLLALTDRMGVTGEVTTAAVQTAAWWLERTDEECDAFVAAASRSTRPDAPALVATAAALPWLRRLHHETLRAPRVISPHRPVPGTGLLVPRAIEQEPPALVARWTEVARGALTAFAARWRQSGAAAVRGLVDWLAGEAPPVLVCHGQRLLWDPAVPERVGAVRGALRDADAVAAEAIRGDLATLVRHAAAFDAAVVDATALPRESDLARGGYCWLDAGRRLFAYDLHEPGMERLRGAPLPFAREMLGARAAHELGHLADVAGFVPRTVSSERWEALEGALAARLDETIAAAPAAIRRATADDLAALSADGASAGTALARIALARLPDFRSNLVARRLESDAEAEAYARHNLRPHRAEYPPPRRWRMLVRHLYEYQYLLPTLGLTRMPDPADVFAHATWFADDFIDTGILDRERFTALAAALDACCAAHAIDPARLRFA